MSEKWGTNTIYNSFFPETSRGCASANNVEGCKGEGSTESCYCQGDLCNSAVSQSVSIVSFLTSMLLYTLLN